MSRLLRELECAEKAADALIEQIRSAHARAGMDESGPVGQVEEIILLDLIGHSVAISQKLERLYNAVKPHAP